MEYYSGKHNRVCLTVVALVMFTATSCESAAPSRIPSTEAAQLPTSIPTLVEPVSTATPEPTATKEIIDLPSCTIDNFRKCDITEYTDEEYFNWLVKTQSRPFDKNKVFPLRFIHEGLLGLGELIYPDFRSNDIKQLINGPVSVPWHRDIGYAVRYISHGGKKYPEMYLPTEYYDKAQDKSFWVVTIDTMYFPEYYVAHGVSEEDINKAIDTKIVPIFKRQFVTPILTKTITPGGTSPDPIVRVTFVKFPDMSQRFEKFANGDLNALSAPGMVLLTIVNSGNLLFNR